MSLLAARRRVICQGLVPFSGGMHGGDFAALGLCSGGVCLRVVVHALDLTDYPDPLDVGAGGHRTSVRFPTINPAKLPLDPNANCAPVYPQAGNPSRRPEIIVEPVQGVVYAAPASKLADHGGFHEQDLHVPLVVVYPHRAAGTIPAPVSLQQIAPTILHALQLKKNAIDAVRMEHTPQLPGLDDDDDLRSSSNR